jgi:hypothetical protein
MEQWVLTTIGLVVSATALGVSAASFYATNFRRGKVEMARPTSLVMFERPLFIDADVRHPTGEFAQCFRLPLVMTNTGAQSVVVEEIRLRVGGPGSVAIHATHGQWKKTLVRLPTEKDLAASGGDYASPFVLAPKAAFERVGLFRSTTKQVLLSEGTYQATVEARLGGDSAPWRPLASLEFTIDKERESELRSANLDVQALTRPMRSI